MDRQPVDQFGFNYDDVGSHGWYTGSYDVDAAWVWLLWSELPRLWRGWVLVRLPFRIVLKLRIPGLWKGSLSGRVRAG
jgi:hypothetical protein